MVDDIHGLSSINEHKLMAAAMETHQSEEACAGSWHCVLRQTLRRPFSSAHGQTVGRHVRASVLLINTDKTVKADSSDWPTSTSESLQIHVRKGEGCSSSSAPPEGRDYNNLRPRAILQTGHMQ